MILRFETVFLVGTGIEGPTGWLPIYDAINEFRDKHSTEADGQRIDSPDAANFWLALHVYRARLFWSKDADETDGFDKEKWRARHKETDEFLKTLLASKIQDAATTGRSHLTARFLRLLEECARGRWGTYAFLSTNWDLLLQRAGVPNNQVFHLHGDVTEPTGLLLPTDFTAENWRSKEERLLFKTRHAQFQRTIGAASRIVIFGLSLSPLDAELGQHISAGFADHAKAPPVTAINLKRDMDRVVSRIQMLWPRGKLDVERVEVPEEE